MQALVVCGLGVWMSFHHTATIRLFHTSTFQRICEVDVTSAVTRMLSGQWLRVCVRAAFTRRVFV